MSGYGLFELGGKESVGTGKRTMAGKVGWWAGAFVAVLLLVLVGAAVYARDLWQQWMSSQAIQAFEWQGLRLSLDGVRAESFSLASSDPGRPFTVQGSGFVLGWNWQSFSLTDVRIERLTIEVPDWTEPESGTPGASPSLLPDRLPAWFPEHAVVRELRVDLPEGKEIRGNLEADLAGDPEQWQLKTSSLWIRGPLPGMAPAGWQFRGAQGNVGFSGTAGVESARLEFLDGSLLRFEHVNYPGGGEPLRLEQLEIRPGASSLEARYRLAEPTLNSLRLTGPLTMDVGSVVQPFLKTQSWHFEGRMKGDRAGFDAHGLVRGAAGLSFDVDTHWPFDGTPELSASARLEGHNASHSLAATFDQWPATLETTGGSLALDATVRLAGASPSVEAIIAADGLSGILDRTAWTGLNGTVELSYEEDALVARTSGLEAAQVNPGLPLAPVSFSGRYQAHGTALAGGTVSVIQARAGFLGGEIRVKPGEWSLARLPVTVPVWLNDIRVDRLMAVYPAEGLAGTGKLQGEVPLVVGRDGVQVAGGSIRAVAPGGTLKLPAERLQVLARNNETMDLVVRALQNFNYSVLNSTIDYDQNGTLNLGLRLEGSNPQVRNGHPIVVNINLQEDIPALLTSLQLSGRVNEAVTERVRKLMEKREAGKTEK